MIPFILPNNYLRLKDLPVQQVETDSNYYAWMADIWQYVEPAYAAFVVWARQRCEGDVADLGAGDGNVGRSLNAKYFYDYQSTFDQCQVLDLTANFDKPQGDTLILSHVLEHLPNPKRSLQTLKDKIDVGTRIIICVPDGGSSLNTALPFHQYIPNNSQTGKHQHHIYAWTQADLFNTLIEQGWEDIEIAWANVCGFETIWALAVKK